MRSTYDEAMRAVFAHEGGYSDDASDPGGPTKYGITIADVRRYLNPRATAADVRALTRTQAEDIYRKHYAAPLRYDDLPAGIDYAVLDYGINSGIGRAGRVLRRCLHLPDESGTVTDAVIAAARATDAVTLISAICDERLRFLRSLKTWAVFGKGWGRRVAEVKIAALAMAAGSSTHPSETPTPGRGMVPVANSAQRGSAAAVIVAGTAVAQQARASGTTLVTVALIMIAAFAAAAGVWLLWRWRQRQQQEKPI
jgi:lysozyme family protein